MVLTLASTVTNGYDNVIWSLVENEAKSLQARQMEKKMLNSDLRASFELKKQGVVE